MSNKYIYFDFFQLFLIYKLFEAIFHHKHGKYFIFDVYL